MRTQPHNDEAEKAILGAILMREDAYDTVSSIIGAEDFYHPMNGEIFRAITKMKEMSNEAVDIITLIDYLKKNGSLEKAGGVGYIAGLTESVNVTSNAEQYARIVKEMSLRRSVLSMSSSLSEKAFDATEDIYKTLDEGQGKMLQLSLSGSTGEEEYSIDRAVSSVVDRIIKKMDGKLADDSVRSGFDVLDKYTNGDEDIENLVAIHLNLFDQDIFGDSGMESVSDGCQYNIPQHGSQGGEKDKFGEFHTSQSCRYGDELPYGRNQSAYQGRNTSVFVEITFGGFDLLLVEQAHMSYAAIGKFVNQRAPYPECQIIVDDSADVGSESTEENYQIHI